MGSQAPFRPWIPQPPPQQQQAPAPYQQPAYGYAQPEPLRPPPEQQRTVEVWCDLCEGKIDWGEEVIELFAGEAGRSEQTGFPMAVTPPGDTPQVFLLHRCCALEFVMYHVCPDDADEIIYNMADEIAQEQIREMNEEMQRKLEDDDE